MDKSELISEYADRMLRWAKDPVEWIRDCVVTKDENDPINPFKPIPIDKDYLAIAVKVWKEERFVAFPKSRQMMLSWVMVACHLWDAMFHKGRLIGCMSKKEDDADALLERMKFILEHIPEDVWPSELRPKWRKIYCEISFPEMNSIVMALPEGADQARSRTFSRLLCDEMAFWDKAKETYSAAIPTLGANSCLTAISSAAPSFFKQIVFDNVDGGGEELSQKRIYPAIGVEIWRNRKNSFVVVQIHYTADPDKRSESFREGKRSSMPYSQYKQEYEISWDTQEGKPVYMDWNRSFHGSKVSLRPVLGLPLILGVDQGLFGAVIVMQYEGEVLTTLKEYCAENMGAERFCDLVMGKLRQDFKDWRNFKDDFIVGMDPTAFNRRDVDERTYASVWSKHFRVNPGANKFEERRSAVEKFLTKANKGSACFRVSMPDCPILTRGFDGGYHYPEKYFEIEPNKARPEKNQDSNPHDALQYGITAFLSKIGKKAVSVPRPHYAWSGENGEKESVENKGFRIIGNPAFKDFRKL